MELVHCIYCSASTAAELTPAEVSELLNNCRSSNAKCEITGMLLYQQRSFFQVLEGDRNVVESLFKKISADPRHERVTKVVQEPIEERAFANGTLGYPRLTAKELGGIPGLNDFFASGKSYLEIGEGRAKNLLAAFKDGRWRTSLS
jgi:hypothetical protein